jgi:hypothetical protein
MADLKPGDRVRVVGHWNWPDDFTGVVAEPLPFAQSLDDGEPWHGHLRTVKGRSRLITSVWIAFDEAQRDGDDDGPYRAGEVELEYVTKL